MIGIFLYNLPDISERIHICMVGYTFDFLKIILTLQKLIGIFKMEIKTQPSFLR